MAIVQATIIPVGTGDTSVSEYVAAIQDVLSSAPEPVKHQMTPMSTIIEGELDDVLAVIRRMHEVPFQKGVRRVSTSITIDDRRDKPSTMEQKMRSVEDKRQMDRHR
ncbi:MTH1187 family thiamine-binding protein [Cohnella zeiphila]|uniref:MTH1187 family thiamine-binding protein n=1 Tax=Cohnella zeiphila TaxID=2761120 RepID=A0A7X0VTU5_9BACL|nr:MTH1187 family thiamine-binding protein [Cohnella zeiphila]